MSLRTFWAFIHASAARKLHYFRYLHVLYRITTLEKSETLDSLPHDFTETKLRRWHFPRGGFREGVQGARISLPIFSGIAHK